MSKVSSGLRRGIEGSEESLKGSKTYQRVRRDIKGFEETLKRFEGNQGLQERFRGLRRGPMTAIVFLLQTVLVTLQPDSRKTAQVLFILSKEQQSSTCSLV